MTSNEEKITHPQELRLLEKRLAQAQQGINRKLVACLYERIKNQRKDWNYKLSLRLVQQNRAICFSKDNIMLAYKSIQSGTQYVKVASKIPLEPALLAALYQGQQAGAV